MKKLSILLAIAVIIIMWLPLDINQWSKTKSNNLKTTYNEILNDASEDAVTQLIDASKQNSIEVIGEGKKENYKKADLNLSGALDRFYETLFMRLNIEKDNITQQSIKYKVPIVIAAGYDGYYINYWAMDGKEQKWTDKKLYTTVDRVNNVIIRFTLDDYVYITDLNTKKEYKGKRGDLVLSFPKTCLKTEKDLNDVKGFVINQSIKHDLEYYTNYNNQVSRKNNWNITFNIPYWGNRSIADISFMVFFQGKLVPGYEECYNTYGFATSKIISSKCWYGYDINGTKLYSNKKMGSNLIYFSSEYEAAKAGYSPDVKNFQ